MESFRKPRKVSDEKRFRIFVKIPTGGDDCTSFSSAQAIREKRVEQGRGRTRRKSVIKHG